MSTATRWSIVVALVLIGGALFLTSYRGSDSGSHEVPGNKNVRMEEGVQIVDLTAKGGYFPKATVARAGVPTVLAVATKGTFDCSSALVVPSVGYRDMLPPSGVTKIEVPPQSPGAVLEGLCSMGMYGFNVRFE